MPVSVEVERPTRPAIWLDTSALINIAKARSGRLTHGVDLERVTGIDRVVRDKVRAGRLLSIDSEQRHEAWPSGFYDFLNALESFSLGVRMRPLHWVRNGEFEVGMKAFLEGASAITIPLRVFFDDDPVEETDKTLRRGMWISARMPQSEELRKHKSEKKQELLTMLEELRKKNVADGVTFEQQLAVEQRATLKAYAELYKRMIWSQVFKPDADETFWHSLGGMALPELLTLWRSLGGGDGKLASFFESEHCHALPQQDIQSRIYADLMTQQDPIKPGDAGDVDHLALVLPVATFVLTDWRMERRVRRLGLAEKWKTRVFSLRTADDLVAALTAL